MGKDEARAIVTHRVAELRAQSFESLRDEWLGQPDCEDHYGPDGTWYQLEISAFWDDSERQRLAVVAGIDVGGWRGEVAEMFLVSPEDKRPSE